jgi:hypothetical protein
MMQARSVDEDSIELLISILAVAIEGDEPSGYEPFGDAGTVRLPTPGLATLGFDEHNGSSIQSGNRTREYFICRTL